jgi:hypothetical protein
VRWFLPQADGELRLSFWAASTPAFAAVFFNYYVYLIIAVRAALHSRARKEARLVRPALANSFVLLFLLFLLILSLHAPRSPRRRNAPTTSVRIQSRR